jgi:hypothetical protein
MMSEHGDCVFELEAGLILVRLLGEGVLGPDLFDHLSVRAREVAVADGRIEISRADLRTVCEEIEAVGVGA